MQHMGLAGRYHKHPGAACKLKPEQLAELKEDLIAGPTKCGFESGMDRSHDQYTSTPSSTSNTAVEDLLHRMFWRKARPKHPKSASKEEREKFKKNHGAGCRIRTQGIHHLSTGRVLHHSGMGQQGMAFNWRGDHHTVWRAVLYSES